MKFIKSKILLFSLLFCSFALFEGCSGDNSGQDAVADENANLTAEAAYVCPMRCEGSGSNEPGKCSVCGMDLVKAVKHNHEEHESHDNGDHAHDAGDAHDHGEEGHDHGEDGHEGHDH